MERVKEFEAFAQAHGFNVRVVQGNKIKAWDNDGEIVTDSMADLKVWLGY